MDTPIIGENDTMESSPLGASQSILRGSEIRASKNASTHQLQPTPEPPNLASTAQSSTLTTRLDPGRYIHGHTYTKMMTVAPKQTSKDEEGIGTNKEETNFDAVQQ